MILPGRQGGLDVEEVFGPDGRLARAYGGFEHRQQQVTMARAVCRAFESHRHVAVEAGTGTGKTFAYLVPAIDQAQQKRKVLVSTYTITLQEQLITKDIPFLAAKLGIPFTACLAKGRNNYLCRRRLRYALTRQRGLFGDIYDELLRIDEWSRTTEDGSLSDLGQAPSAEAWDAVMSEHGNCRGRKCDNFADCFYWRARRLLKTADIIVANHALLLSDLILKKESPGILPEFGLVVVDEAHNLEHVAEEQFGIDISNYTITYLLNRLYSPRTRKGLLAFVQGADEACAKVRALERAAKEFFAKVQTWLDAAPKDECGRCPPNFIEDGISPAVKGLRGALSKLARDASDEDDRAELTRYVDRCRSLEGELGDFLSQSRPDSVYWVETAGVRQKRVVLRSAPLDVGPHLREYLFDAFESVVLTSATLSTGGDDAEAFAFFASRVGLQDFDAVRLGSPFDYKSQVTMYVEAGIPAPTHEGFESAAAEAIGRYLLQSQGRAFVLFTSYSMLRSIAARLEAFLAENSMELLCQGSGQDRSTILERFKTGSRCVLFGTDSFWQGVDVPGEALSNVTIVRLPFAVPNHPLVQGRIEYLRSRGENPFYSYQLPTAILKFKQGFGRLIRTKTDTGIVVVLDSRIVTRPYGRLFLDALPECTVRVIGRPSRDAEDDR